MSVKMEKMCFILFLFLYFVWGAHTVAATEKTTKIVFVLDCSNSMNFNDNERIANEMMKLFLDTCFENDEVGFIFYNDSILQQYPLSPIADKMKLEEMKSIIRDSPRKGSTDIGLALKRAVDMLSQEENQNSAIIIFSDGETDLNFTRTKRTMEDSKNDEAYALHKAKEIDCPIFSVGLNKTGNMEYLYQISEATNGIVYKMQSVSELPVVFQNLYEKITGIQVNTIEKLTGKGKEEVILALPENFADTVHILVHYTKDIDGTVVDGGNSTVEIHKENYYTAVRISEFSDGQAFLRFLSENGDSIVINKIENTVILPEIEIPENTSLLNVPVNIKLYQKNTGKQVDKSLYEALQGELIVTDPRLEKKERLTLGNTGTMLTATYVNSNPGEIIFQAEITGENYRQISPAVTVNFSNTPPEFLKASKIPVLKQEKEAVIDLNDYFYDRDGDVLTYQIEEDTKQKGIFIDKNLLKLFPEEEGKKEISVYVSDGRGGVITGNLTLSIQPFLTYYKNIWTTVACIFFALLFLYFILSKRKQGKPDNGITENAPFTDVVFHGARFEGYFLKTFSGNEIPVLYWNASYINDKHIIHLGELLRILEVEEKLPEARKIYFEAGKNGTVIFYHDTNCIINIGTRDIPAGKKEVLHFDDRLYIVFEDHVTEIEIRYKRTRRKSS